MTVPVELQSPQKFLRFIPWEAFVNIATIVACTAYVSGEIHMCTSRTDKLYEICIENQKSSSEKFLQMQKDMDQKFYDLLKESKK